MSQLDIFDVLDADRCRYGIGADYPRPLCDRPATHRAHWAKGDASGSVACCRDHANYYANAWFDGWLSPASTSVAWIETLAVAP